MSEPIIRIAQVANLENRLASAVANISVSSNGVFSTNANGFNFVNTATVQITVAPGANGNANISFESSGSGGTVVVRDNFTGDGNTVNFTLTTEPEDQDHTLVFVDLVFQSESAYSISGSTLTFATAPDNGANVDVYIYGGGVGSTVVTSDVFTGTGACTTYTLTQTATTSRTFVYLDGVAQRPQYDYQVSGTTLSFNVAPANATVVEVRTLSAFNTVDLNVAPVSLYSDKFTGTGSCTQFTLSQTGTTDSTFVFLNGVSQKPGTDFSVGGVGNTTLTLTSAPANGSVLEVRTVGAFRLSETQSRIESDIFTGDGNTVSFTMSTGSTTKKTFAFIDGVAQKPVTDYSVGGNIITFTEAPPSGTFIEVRSVAPFIFATSTGELAYAQANAAYALASNAVLKTGSVITGNLIVSVNTSNDAIRITQTGSGNAIIIEDETNPDASPFVVTNSGNVGIGTANPISYFHANVQSGTARMILETAAGNTTVSPLNLWNANTGNGVGVGMVFTAGGDGISTGFIGGVLSRKIEDGTNSRTFFRVLSGNSITGVSATDTNLPFYLEGNTAGPRVVMGATTVLQQSKERVNVSATAMGANLFINLLDGAVTLLTANATANSTLNIRGNSTITLDTLMAVGESMTTVMMVTNGATAYRIANLQIDGTAVTPKWSGGSAPTASANSVDTYSFTMVKTAANTYTVLGSKTQFA
jgi:hypothetical protein